MRQGDLLQYLIGGSVIALAFLVKDYRTTPYDREFAGAAARWNVPGNLLKAIGQRETGKWWGGKIPDGDNGKSFGVMQVQLGTVKGSPYGATDLRAPENSIGAGAWYLNRLRSIELPPEKFSLDTWIAAYNAGSPAILSRGVFNVEYVAAVKQFYYLYEMGGQIA